MGTIFPQKGYLGDLMFYTVMASGSDRGISRVSGNDEDYKITAEADTNKNVPLENIN